MADWNCGLRDMPETHSVLSAFIQPTKGYLPSSGVVSPGPGYKAVSSPELSNTRYNRGVRKRFCSCDPYSICYVASGKTDHLTCKC